MPLPSNRVLWPVLIDTSLLKIKPVTQSSRSPFLRRQFAKYRNFMIANINMGQMNIQIELPVRILTSPSKNFPFRARTASFLRPGKYPRLTPKKRELRSFNSTGMLRTGPLTFYLSPGLQDRE
jgi:hypothetical protein